MAKVTDLNGCFVKCNPSSPKGLKASKAAYSSSENGFLGYIVRICDSGLLIARDEKEMIRAHDQLAAGLINEIYFHDGEFFDEPMIFQDSDLLNIPWTDGSIDEQEVIGGWRHGDECLINRDGPDGERLVDIGTFYAETTTHYWLHGIGGGDKADAKGSIYSKEKYWLSKPETEAEKKIRELAEEVNRICFDLFGTPAFDCNQDIIDTVEKFIVNGYKKVD